jgi:hypothetical protein
MAVYSNYLNALPHYSRAPEMNKITLPLLLKRHHLVLVRSTILGLRSSLPRLDLQLLRQWCASLWARREKPVIDIALSMLISNFACATLLSTHSALAQP